MFGKSRQEPLHWATIAEGGGFWLYGQHYASNARAAGVPELAPGQRTQVAFLGPGKRRNPVQLGNPGSRSRIQTVHSYSPGVAAIFGMWDQAWGNFTRLGIGTCLVQRDRPVTEVYTYKTDVDGVEDGPYLLPEALLATEHGWLLVTRLAQMVDEAFVPWGMRVRLLSPASPSWNSISHVDIEFELDRDKAIGNFHPDSNAFWDQATQTLTLFSRQAVSSSGSWTEKLASVWTVRVADHSGVKSLYVVGLSEVTVANEDNERQTMLAPNVAGPWMQRTLSRGYRLLASGLWSNAWGHTGLPSWFAQLQAAVGLEGDPSYTLLRPSVSNFQSRSNGGAPGYVKDGHTRWLTHAVCGAADTTLPQGGRATVAPGNSVKVKALSASVSAESGELADSAVFWEHDGYRREDCITLSICWAWADWMYAVDAARPPINQFLQEHESFNTISSSYWDPGPGPGSADGSVLVPYSYTYTTKRTWLGFIQESAELHYGTDYSILRYLPYRGISSGDLYLPALQNDMPIGCPRPVLLPCIQGANYRTGYNAIWLFGYTPTTALQRSTRCPDNGVEFAAIWVPIPIYTPGTGTVGNNRPGNAPLYSSEQVKPPTMTSTGPDGGYREVRAETTHAAIPSLNWAWELRICRGGGGHESKTVAPLDRHTGLWWDAAYGSESTSFVLDEALPIAEQVWDKTPLAYTGIVAWLHDHRPEGWMGSPRPMLRITDYDLNTAYTISLEELLASVPAIEEGEPNPREILAKFETDTEWGPKGTEYKWDYSRNAKPCIRLQKRPIPELPQGWYEHFWWIGIEATERVEQVEGRPGRVWALTWCLKLETDHFEVLSCTYDHADFTYPAIPSLNTQGPGLLERMSMSSTHRAYAVGDGKIRAASAAP